MKFRSQLLAVLVLCFLSVGPAGRALPGEGAVSFEELTEGRSRYLGQEQTLILQYDGEVETWEPYLTRFGPERFRGLRAWADEQLPWNEADFLQPAVFVFLAKDHPQIAEFEQLERHQRLAVRVLLREVFAGHAWIEVLSFQVLEESIGEGCLLHAIEARRFEESKAYDLAIDQYERALAAPLPDHARQALSERVTACRKALAGPSLDRRRRGR